MVTVKLTSLPFLTPSYEHVMDFESYDSKMNYFNKLNSLSYYVEIKTDGMRTTVTIPEQIDDLLGADYLWYTSLGADNKRAKSYFYFITNKQYETMSTTTLTLELDVWTTYHNNLLYWDSFIDRCHVPRWLDGMPTQHTIDEGLDMGELQQYGTPEKIADFNDSIVITSTVPLGKVPNVSGGQVGGSGNCWEEGKASPQGFRFLKGFEGFASREYQDSGGYWTIGYGTTKHGEPDVYSQLASKQPITEEEGARVSYDLLQKNYGLHILDAVKVLGCNNQNQFDALLSVAYNSGNGSVTGSNSLTQAIAKNPNDESTIRPIWESFKVTSNGIPLEGLRLRRIQECNMYFGKEVEIRPIGLIGSGGNVTGTLEGDGWLPPD